MNPTSGLNSVILNIQISCFVYWNIFKKRFLDYYFLVIQKNYINYFNAKFDNNNSFLAKLDTFSPGRSERGKKLLCEDPRITTRRVEIIKSLKAFADAEIQLENVLF